MAIIKLFNQHQAHLLYAVPSVEVRWFTFQMHAQTQTIYNFLTRGFKFNALLPSQHLMQPVTILRWLALTPC